MKAAVPGPLCVTASPRRRVRPWRVPPYGDQDLHDRRAHSSEYPLSAGLNWSKVRNAVEGSGAGAHRKTKSPGMNNHTGAKKPHRNAVWNSSFELPGETGGTGSVAFDFQLRPVGGHRL